MRRKNIRVLFLTPYPTEGPSNRYRVEQYLPFLKEAGIDYDIRSFMDSDFYGIIYSAGRYWRKLISFLRSTYRRLADICKAKDYDIVFIHLEAFPFGPPFMEWVLARLMRKPIIFDFEDAIYLKRRGRCSWFTNFIKRPWKFYGILRLSAHVLVCNQFMENLVSEYNSNVTVMPTSIDTEKFTVKTHILQADKPVLGWIGTPSTLQYLEGIAGALRELSERYKFMVKIVGGGKDVEIPGVKVVNEKWTLEKDIENFQSIDIGLYPLPHDERAMAKTPFKAVQYMSVGIPVVASRAGSIENIIKDGINGFLINTEDEWIGKLSILLEDDKLRRKIGIKGREAIEECYSLRLSASRMIDIIQKVYYKHC